MHELPQRTLCKLLIMYGPDLHTDPRRTEAFLRDLCGEYQREIFVLVNAQKQGVATDLLTAPSWMPQTLLHTQLSQRLQENLALTPVAADWAVTAWAGALHIGPNPPDRVWVWLQQYKPTLRPFAWGQRIHVNLPTIHPKIPPLGGRLFSRFGVQWRQILSRLGWLLERPGVASGWLKRQGQHLLRPSLLVGVTAIFCVTIAATSVQQINQPSAVVALTASHLATAYPLPRAAWVRAGPLYVRAGPSTTAGSLGWLPEGEVVTVRLFSEDGAWSQIRSPVEGWVSNEFLRFQSEGVLALDTVLRLERGRPIAASVNVRSGPGTDYAILGYLSADQTVVIVATHSASGWKQIIMPMQGWVRADLVQVDQITYSP